jgi:hypothetical protein
MPDGGPRGAPEDHGVPEKNADGPLPRFHPAAVPDISQGSFVRPATAGVRDTVLRVANSPPATMRRATKSVMNLKNLPL